MCRPNDGNLHVSGILETSKCEVRHEAIGNSKKKIVQNVNPIALVQMFNVRLEEQLPRFGNSRNVEMRI